MQRSLIIAGVAAASVILNACATAPRSAAGRLGDAGIRAAGSFASDTAALGIEVAGAGLSEAFLERYQACKASTLACSATAPGAPGQPADPRRELRQKLADTIQLRANALGALGQAYGALKREADYDARGDMTDAVNDAVSGVNVFAAAAFGLAGAPIPLKIGNLIGLAGGLIADNRQKARIMAANAKLREVTQRLHDALAAEAGVFGIIGDANSLRRTEVLRALNNEGLIDSAELIRPIAETSGVPLAPDTAARISASPALQAAVETVIAARAEAETARARQRYRASLAAMTALIAEHDSLAATGSVSLGEVNRLLEEINAALAGKDPHRSNRQE